jgi:hypothetical protein
MMTVIKNKINPSYRQLLRQTKNRKSLRQSTESIRFISEADPGFHEEVCLSAWVWGSVVSSSAGSISKPTFQHIQKLEGSFESNPANSLNPLLYFQLSVDVTNNRYSSLALVRTFKLLSQCSAG